MRVYQVYVHNAFNIEGSSTYLPLAIRLKTGKHFNHTGLLFYEDGEWWFVHAIYPKVVKVKYTEWLVAAERETITIPFETELSEEQTIHNINEQVGKPYNIKGLLQNDLYLTFGLWLGEKNDYSSLYCWELPEVVKLNPDAYKAMPKRKKIK